MMHICAGKNLREIAVFVSRSRRFEVAANVRLGSDPDVPINEIHSRTFHILPEARRRELMLSGLPAISAPGVRYALSHPPLFHRLRYFGGRNSLDSQPFISAALRKL
jgi:hypothetical protein